MSPSATSLQLRLFPPPSREGVGFTPCPQELDPKAPRSWTPNLLRLLLHKRTLCPGHNSQPCWWEGGVWGQEEPSCTVGELFPGLKAQTCSGSLFCMGGEGALPAPKALGRGGRVVL